MQEETIYIPEIPPMVKYFLSLKLFFNESKFKSQFLSA